MGMPIRQAAVVCGIPEAELLDYAAKQALKPAELSYELRALAERTLKKGIESLEKIIDGGPRLNDELTTHSNVDLSAAQTIVKVGMELLKLSIVQNPESRGKTASATIQLDLWDNAGAWELKKPGAD